MAHDVFISYAHKDKPTGDAVCATLEARGIRCWMAPRDVLPGVIYSGAIVEAIHASRVFVLVFSAEANISPHVMRELERAVNDGIPVLPLRIEDVPLSPSMEYFISTPHWLDALTPPLEKHLVQLAETVKVLLQRADAAAEAKRAVAAPPNEAPQTVPPQTVPPPAVVAPPPTPPTIAPAPEAKVTVATREHPAGPAAVARPETPAGAMQPVGQAGTATAPTTAIQAGTRAIPARAITGFGALGVVLVVALLVASALANPGPAASPTGSSQTGLLPSATALQSASPMVTLRPSPTARRASWFPIFDTPIEREGATAQLLANGMVLVVGGVGPEGPLASAELYDPNTKTWTVTSSMTTARKDHTMTLLPDGKVLVAGGIGGVGDISATNKPLASAELYDPATGSWTVTGSMISRRSNHTATALADATVLVAGGFESSGGPQTSAEIYDPSRGTWRATSSMHLDRWAFMAVRLADGRVLAAGSGGPIASSPQTELYDPQTGRWTKTGSMATGRAQATLTLLDDDRVLVAGGTLNMGTGEVTAKSELFDPATGTWQATAAMSVARALSAAIPLHDGTVLVVGGEDPSRTFATCDRFDPTTETWAAAPAMATERARFTATLLEGGWVLVVGGAPSAELFDPGD